MHVNPLANASLTVYADHPPHLLRVARHRGMVAELGHPDIVQERQEAFDWVCPSVVREPCGRSGQVLAHRVV